MVTGGAEVRCSWYVLQPTVSLLRPRRPLCRQVRAFLPTTFVLFPLIRLDSCPTRTKGSHEDQRFAL
ncbi:hypothetical protein PVAP13_6KG331800 [Panicum virgatum]|uniref:Uncharacterized protein n=1 Tax=Panicum virgatum TaxID=38727 RepID=A0A8T0RIM1_PANVG|nr:hypothetical protein PVAP13_6KG331800 [Panicum virgatum]